MTDKGQITTPIFAAFFQNAERPKDTCADPESIVRGGPTLTRFFLIDEGREDPNTTISVPLTARQRTPLAGR